MKSAPRGHHRPRKRFGQHFLRDPEVIARILNAANPRTGDCFVEIGPGLGALTVPLLQRLDHLHAVELDRDMIPHLTALSGTRDRLSVHQADALQFDFATLNPGVSLRIIGNLPYNISTPLLFHLLKFNDRVLDMHFMLQREVAARLAAQANSEHYGRLSIICQYHCQVNSLFDVPPEAFSPPPKVHSTVVCLRPHPRPPVAVGDRHYFDTLLRHAFAHRRKTLRNNLKSLLSAEQIASCQIEPEARAQTLQLKQFAALARRLNK